MARWENKMYETIYAHRIEYSWEDGIKRKLDECDIEHIQSLLKEDYVQGELCQYDHEKETEQYGWWSIANIC
jgi:hypothetical protein